MKYHNQFNINLNKDYYLGQLTKTILLAFCIVFTSCSDKKKELIAKDETTAPLFKNSIASTDIDFIKKNDPDAFLSLEYKGQKEKEMPGSGSGNLMDTNTYVFEANFENNQKVEIWAHSSFGSENTAQEYAEKLTGPLGKLPTFMRAKLRHVVLHNGDGTNSSEDEGGFIMIYSDKIDTRILNNDLEETVFHETAHVSLDIPYSKRSNAWKEVQTKDDGIFITEYGKNNPNREDLAESALFAYTMIKYPGRLSADTEKWVKTNMPNRLAFFKTVF